LLSPSTDGRLAHPKLARRFGKAACFRDLQERFELIEIRARQAVAEKRVPASRRESGR